MKLLRYSLLLFTTFISFNCNQIQEKSDSATPLFSLLPPEQTGVTFSNKLFETTDLNIINFEYFYNGAGVAVGDINQDGLQDIYFSGNMVEGKLYLNKGDFKFEDITKQAGITTANQWGTGVSMVDINGDGLLDLYLCFAGPYSPERRKNKLYINQGDLTFEEQAEAYGIADNAHTTHAAFFDYDKDGDLDVYLLNNITDETGPNIIRPKRANGEMPNTDRLYRNDDGHFSNVSQEAGILKEGYGLGVSIGDINQDGWPDIYVSNDYLSNDLLYINNQDGTFSDKAEDYFRHTSYSSMGCDLADFNNDGLLDIVAVDMLPPDQTRRKLMMGSNNYNRFRSEILTGYFPQYMRNTLQLNQGKAQKGDVVYNEIGQLAGIHSTDWSWSPLFQDLDNDGLKDLVISNGYPRDITNMDFAAYKANLLLQKEYNEEVLYQLIKAVNQIDGAYLPNFIYQNKGNLQFEDQSQAWGFTQPSFSHGAALADLDNDGDLDYIVNNSYDPVFIYENKAQQIKPHHYIRLQLEGPTSNTLGLGSKIWLYQDSEFQYQELSPYRGFQSSIEPYLHFGLGKKSLIDSIKIQWPDGAWQLIPNPKVDQVLAIKYQPNSKQQVASSRQQALFERVHTDNAPQFIHQEPHYADFNVQPLLPNKHSQDGPPMAVGDINGDGLEDFFIGGAFRQRGQLFLQQTNGTFRSLPIGETEAESEDTGALFFDADQDGDLDLYVCSGSSEFPIESTYYQDRLYQNNGNDEFLLRKEALPQLLSSTNAISTADFDQDGDLDLFVGGRVTPGAYPVAPLSYVLKNEAGTFSIATSEVAPALEHFGMITDAQWTDINQDNWPDLIVAGEWLPISIFINQQGKLVNKTQALGLEQTVGWWNRIAPYDLDQDGDLDFILGNLGLNAPFQTSLEQPVSLHIADFDENQKLDPILTYYLEDRHVPVHFRDDLLNWVFPLKKRFTSYASYAETNWEELFPGQEAQRIDAHIFETCWLENKGEAGLELHKLPIDAQTAPIFGIVASDFNGDKYPDLLFTGNTSAPDTHTGQYDAFNGLLLLGNENKEFRPQSIQQSGFYVPGEGRGLKLLEINQTQHILASQNNGSLLTFRLKKNELIE